MSTPTTQMFVYFGLEPSGPINNTPAIIFTKNYNCILDSVWLTNLTENETKIVLSINRAGITNIYDNNIVLEAYQRTELLKGSVLILEALDALYGYTDYSGNQFNSFISHRQLLELGVENARARNGKQ